MDIEYFFEQPQYSLAPEVKQEAFLETVNALSAFHHSASEPYRRIVDLLHCGQHTVSSLEEVPYFPVQLFKTVDLVSVPPEEIFKIMMSSGTTGQIPSRIHLDRHTSGLQRRALAEIMQSFLGASRLPMVIVDAASTVKNRKQFNARSAGIVGMMNFGRSHFFALNEDMSLDVEGLKRFLERFQGTKILVFGFTFMVWQYLYKFVVEQEITGIDFGSAVLVHSGGWKKLIDQRVEKHVFNRSLRDALGIVDVHNFYGMVEQVGGVYMDCEEGYFHASNFSEVIVRDHRDWGVQQLNEKGVIQSLSVLPHSFPGHSLLTEDLGVIHGHDGCECGRRGTYFSIHGRIPAAEIRGCSDVHAAR